MKIKRHITLDRMTFIYLIFGMIFGMAFAVCIAEAVVFGWILFGIATIAPLIGLVLTPCYYIFDDEGVTLGYLFLPRERYLWSNIRGIEVEFDPIYSSGSSSAIDLIAGRVFSIKGYVEGKLRFYMKGYVRKSFRTKRLFEKYWDGTITGYFGEDLKNWWSKKRKKQRNSVKSSTKEVIAIENQARGKAKDIVAPYHNEAVQYGFEIRKRFVYVTEKHEELNSRPPQGYTYTMMLEVSRPGETDEDKIWCVDIELVYVRVGKSSYKGIENKHAAEELQFWLRDALEGIKNGEFENWLQ